MKIVHVIPNVGASSFGPAQVVLHLAKEQLRLGHESRIWCLDGEADRRWAAEFCGYDLQRIEGFAVSAPRPLRMSREMERAALRETGEIEVMHQHALWTGVSRVPSLLRRRCGVPAVVSPHGALEEWALKKSRWKKAVALSLYERSNLRHAACLHACSEQEVPGLRAFGLNNPVAVIPNGIGSSWLMSEGDGARFRDRFGIPREKRILLYLSRITPVKGLPLLIEALTAVRRQLDDWTVVIAGGDQFGHLSEVQEAVSRRRLGEHVVFTGLLDGQDKRDAFAAAELFVLPTRREAAPVVVLEALGAGVPVVTTKGAPWEDLVRHRCGWWVEVDSGAIAEALKAAMGKGPEELRFMGGRGKELVAFRYSWERSAEMTVELYRWLLGQGARPEFVQQ